MSQCLQNHRQARVAHVVRQWRGVDEAAEINVPRVHDFAQRL
jgi:hypothetical protein